MTRHHCQPGVVLYWLLAFLGGLSVSIMTLTVWLCFRHDAAPLVVIAVVCFGAVTRVLIRDLASYRRLLFACRLPGCKTDRADGEPFCAFHMHVDKLSREQ